VIALLGLKLRLKDKLQRYSCYLDRLRHCATRERQLAR
jgi:hypothetical protein